VTAGGVVRRASEDDLNGRVLIIDHGRGVTTAYCHNSELDVHVGQVLERGQVISHSGNTGRSTGPHLHYQLELGHAPVDPLLFHARSPSTVELPGPKPAPKLVPAVFGRATSDRRVEIAGRGFAPRLKLGVLVNDSVPHASVACNQAFFRATQADAQGAFSVALELPRASACSFACGADGAPLQLFATSPDGTELRSKPFPCWRKGASPPRSEPEARGPGDEPGTSPVAEPSDALKAAFGKAAAVVDGGTRDDAPPSNQANETEY